MPTYLVYAQTGALSVQQVQQLAQAVTRCHSEATGAPPSFVQCLFQPVQEGSRFIGGRPADPRGVYVHGLIRAGRPESVRNQLATGIRDAISALADVPQHLAWVYLTEVPHGDMVEFGDVLPEPGHEEGWIARLPAEVRAQVLAE